MKISWLYKRRERKVKRLLAEMDAYARYTGKVNFTLNQKYAKAAGKLAVTRRYAVKFFE